MFFSRDQAERLPCVEVMVDARIVLIAINLISVSIGQVESVLAADEGNEPGIQTIGIQRPEPHAGGDELVRRRHAFQFLLNKWSGGNSRPESRRIPILFALVKCCALVGAV